MICTLKRSQRGLTGTAETVDSTELHGDLWKGISEAVVGEERPQAGIGLYWVLTGTGNHLSTISALEGDQLE